MRVTEKMVFQTAVDNSLLAREKLQQVTGEVSSGRRIEFPSDDPGAAGQLALARTNGARFDAIRTSLGRATDEISAADGALGQIQNALSRARELAVQMANGTYTANDRTGAASEVDGLVAGVIGVLNTQVGNRFIFGGNKDSTAPFDATGAYLGDTGVHRVEIAPGVYENASVRADVAIKGVGGGVDVLGTLQTLSAALKSNDPTAVAGAFSQIDQGIAQVSRASSDVGASENVFDTAATVNLQLRDGETKRGSALGDVDIVDASSRLTLANQALNAALSASAKSFQLTLLDKLG